MRCVLDPFMSATATVSVASPTPDPCRVGPATLPRVGLLLRIVRRLVAYGTDLVSTLQEGTSIHRRVMTVMNFGTKDLALIIARIKCGLLRAAALEARLTSYVKRGRDLPLPRARSAASRARTAADKASRPAEARAWFLEALPTAEEIAAQVRRRAIGLVIGDICLDLGLVAGAVDGVLWEALTQAVAECGIDLRAFIRGKGEPEPLCLDDDDPDVVALMAWNATDGAAAAVVARGPPG
jgi:hypothetical protein